MCSQESPVVHQSGAPLAVSTALPHSIFLANAAVPVQARRTHVDIPRAYPGHREHKNKLSEKTEIDCFLSFALPTELFAHMGEIGLEPMA